VIPVLPNDITFDLPCGRFLFRVVGVAIHDGHALLHRAVSDDFWSLPGGRGKVMEASSAALVREMQEELGMTVRVGRLLWLVENFFTYAGVAYHEIGVYYLMTLPDDAPQLDTSRPFPGQDDNVALIFQWFPLGELPALRLYPQFLRAGLQALPDHIQHVVTRNDDAGDAGASPTITIDG